MRCATEAPPAQPPAPNAFGASGMRVLRSARAARIVHHRISAAGRTPPHRRRILTSAARSTADKQPRVAPPRGARGSALDRRSTLLRWSAQFVGFAFVVLGLADVYLTVLYARSGVGVISRFLIPLTWR